MWAEKMGLNPKDRQSYIEEFAASIEQGRRLVQGKSQFAGPILMRAEGIDAYLLLLEDRVRFQPKEERIFLSQGYKGSRDILLSRISSVRLKKATALGNGYINFLLVGESESKSPDTVRSENTLMFKAAHQAEFERLKTAIETKIATARIRPPQSQARNISYIEELEQLASLRDRGIITDDEFAAKKRQILGI